MAKPVSQLFISLQKTPLENTTLIYNETWSVNVTTGKTHLATHMEVEELYDVLTVTLPVPLKDITQCVHTIIACSNAGSLALHLWAPDVAHLCCEGRLDMTSYVNCNYEWQPTCPGMKIEDTLQAYIKFSESELEFIAADTANVDLVSLSNNLFFHALGAVPFRFKYWGTESNCSPRHALWHLDINQNLAVRLYQEAQRLTYRAGKVASMGEILRILATHSLCLCRKRCRNRMRLPTQRITHDSVNLALDMSLPEMRLDMLFALSRRLIDAKILRKSIYYYTTCGSCVTVFDNRRKATTFHVKGLMPIERDNVRARAFYEDDKLSYTVYTQEAPMVNQYAMQQELDTAFRIHLETVLNTKHIFAYTCMTYSADALEYICATPGDVWRLMSHR